MGYTYYILIQVIKMNKWIDVYYIDNHGSYQFINRHYFYNFVEKKEICKGKWAKLNVFLHLKVLKKNHYFLKNLKHILKYVRIIYGLDP